VLVPGVVVGLVPWLLTGWDAHDAWPPSRLAGRILVVAGVGALLHALGRFVLEGFGTPAPVAPTRQLVVGGVYRHVRNPMYLAVVGAIAGQALIFARPVLLAYAALVLVLVAVFARLYEQPTLMRTYGAEYEAYRRAVPAWCPRLRSNPPMRLVGQDRRLAPFDGGELGRPNRMRHPCQPAPSRSGPHAPGTS
jgi:protein-S-isoprenylcysteine O-methyltransferase Ste14